MPEPDESTQRLERLVRLSRLLDTYGALLTPHQRELCRASWDNDLSLAEIAEDYGISRQAVHDAVRKASDVLENYETALGLVAQGVDATALHRGEGATNDPSDAVQLAAPSATGPSGGVGGRDPSLRPPITGPSETALDVAAQLEKMASRARAQGAVYDARGLAAQLEELAERLRGGA